MNRLRELRTLKKCTQINVQMNTGIDQSEYSKMERGERQPTYEQCQALALFYNTSMDYIAGLTDIKEPYPRSKK